MSHFFDRFPTAKSRTCKAAAVGKFLVAKLGFVDVISAIGHGFFLPLSAFSPFPNPLHQYNNDDGWVNPKLN